MGTPGIVIHHLELNSDYRYLIPFSMTSQKRDPSQPGPEQGSVRVPRESEVQSK